MEEIIFADDLSGQGLGQLPKYWRIESPPGGGSYNTTHYLRVGTFEGEPVVEAAVPKVYQLGYVRGPEFERVRWLAARMSGWSSLTSNHGLPNLGVGARDGDHVRLGLARWGRTLWVTAHGAIAGEPFSEPLCVVGDNTRYELHRYGVRLAPRLEFWFDGELVGTKEACLWDLGGWVRVEGWSDIWGEPARRDAGLCFRDVEVSGSQPHAAEMVNGTALLDPAAYRCETRHTKDNSAYGSPEGWQSVVRRRGAAGWEYMTTVSGATHMNLSAAGTGVLLGAWYRPGLKAIQWGPIGGGVPVLQGYEFPTLLVMREAGLALLVCYRAGNLYAFRGRQTSSGGIVWETHREHVISEGNVFPQRAGLAQGPDGELVVLFVDREKTLQERRSTDFGETWG